MITITPIPAPGDPSVFGLPVAIAIILATIVILIVGVVVYILKWIKDNPIT